MEQPADEYPPTLDLRLWPSTNDWWHNRVLCATCGYDCMHPVAVEVNRGGDLTAIDARGVYQLTGAPTGRGVRVTTVFACEDGHRTLLHMQFHKGHTYVWAARGPDYEGAIPAGDVDAYQTTFGVSGIPATIWRD